MNSQIRIISDKIISIAKKHGVKRIALFGSIVRDQFDEKSDIDILVEFDDGKTLIDLVNLELELKKELERNIDVITYRSIHPLLKERILNEQLVIL